MSSSVCPNFKAANWTEAMTMKRPIALRLRRPITWYGVVSLVNGFRGFRVRASMVNSSSDTFNFAKRIELAWSISQAICAWILKQVGGKKSYLPGREKKNTNELAKPSPEQGSSSKSNRIRDRLNTLLLATTLIATVTFAAGFTLPGGYNQSNPDIGMTTLAHRWAFQVFVICDAVAFFSSFVSAVMIVRGMHDTQDVELMNFCTDIGGLLSF